MDATERHLERLRAGETIKIRPRGNSMLPRIESGQLCTIRPVVLDEVRVGSVALCRVRGRIVLHLVSAIQPGRKGEAARLFQISNNHGHVNGWVGERSMYGLLAKVEP